MLDDAVKSGSVCVCVWGDHIPFKDVSSQISHSLQPSPVYCLREREREREVSFTNGGLMEQPGVDQLQLSDCSNPA